MSKTAKIWLIVAGSLTALGALMVVGALAMIHWNPAEFGAAAYTTDTYEITDSFDSVSVDASAADTVFRLSDNKTCKIDCRGTKGMKFKTSVQNKTLTVKAEADPDWTVRLSSLFNHPQITVYLPEKQYRQLAVVSAAGDVLIPGDFSFDSISINAATTDVDCAASVSGDLQIHCVTGDVTLSSLSAGDIDIAVTTGDIRLKDVAAKGDVTVNTTTSDILLSNTYASKEITLGAVTGDILFDRSDASQITAQTTTGDITGTLCSDKIFSVKTTTGDTDVPDTARGGNCVLTTGVGDICIRIEKNDPTAGVDSINKN